jgi:hypothetical protein
MQKEAEAEEHRMKAEERTQHMKLLEMLHEGKISRDVYEAIKTLGFLFILFLLCVLLVYNYFTNNHFLYLKLGLNLYKIVR